MINRRFVLNLHGDSAFLTSFSIISAKLVSLTNSLAGSKTPSHRLHGESTYWAGGEVRRLTTLNCQMVEKKWIPRKLFISCHFSLA